VQQTGKFLNYLVLHKNDILILLVSQMSHGLH
jgi:hypothetical protein